jgi:hypothetical protein
MSDGVAERNRSITIRPCCEAAKVQDLHFHDLRREFGSQLLEAGRRSTGCAHARPLQREDDGYLPAVKTLKGDFRRLAQHRARKRLKVVARCG